MQVIVTDMAPFLTILGITMLGCSLCFAINSPSSDEFSFASTVAGPLQPFLTVYQTMLGMDGGAAISETTSGVAMLMIVFFMGFVAVIL